MANQIIQRGEIVEDIWTHLEDDQDLPTTGDVSVSLERWANDRDALNARDGRLALRLDPEDDVRTLKDDLVHFHMIVIAFPVFTDGRGYSHARILRDQLGYQGELRAVGEVLRDQIFYMHRVGFESFETAPGLSLDSALEGLRDFSVTYQAAADDPRPLFRRADDRRQAES